MSWRKAVAVAVVHLAIVSSLAGKLLIDRASRPRVWVKAAPVDPDLPIRGRYVALRLELHASDPELNNKDYYSRTARLEVRNGELWAIPYDRGTVEIQRWMAFRSNESEEERTRRLAAAPVTLAEPVDFFIPEHVPDPSRRAAGEELWVEATIPRAGPPRPLRLGVKRHGQIEPLDLR
jgi:uncharacterized membrane-anchored protein